MKGEAHNFDTLVEATNALHKEGYTENFEAKDDCIIVQSTKKGYQPNEIKIVDTFRFDGMTNPSDDMELFALEAHDGTKGTLVMSYSSEHSQNVELIKAMQE